MTIARTLLDELACVLPERDEREAPRAVRCLEDELAGRPRAPQTHKRVLAVPVRERIMAAILATEWSDTRAIAVRAGVGTGTVLENLREPVEAGLVERRIENRAHLFRLTRRPR